MRQCIFIIGTRAQLVKVAPVLQVASQAGLDHVLWFTGQHSESIGDLIEDFGIDSEMISARQWRERSSILRLVMWVPGTFLGCYRYVRGVRKSGNVAPLVIVHGDTLSTFIGALAGKLAGAKVVHLESGLSSGKMTDPFPEEILRRLTFRLTDFALCPNDEAFNRMQAAGSCEVVHTGENTLLDCVRYASRSASEKHIGDQAGYFVASIHRFQNIYRSSALSEIVAELIALSRLGAVHFILHPPTENRLRKTGLYERLLSEPGIRLRSRMPYTEFLALVSGARGVISDGGSNQEELSYLGVPTILFRERSERPDGLGENIVLRSELAMPLADFVKSGSLDALRRASRIAADAKPSDATVDALIDWAA